MLQQVYSVLYLLYFAPWRSQRRYNHREHTVSIRAKETTITPLPHPPLNRLRDIWSSRSPLLLFALKSALAAGLSWEIVFSLLGEEAAALVAHLLGLNIWTITLMIFFAQIIGMFLQNRGQYLATQIPISAALALVLGATAGNYPLLRMLGALVGGLIGTVISL